ncbi:hypothetical protein JCM19046_651 [Bacillus sp. JCM 19046]|nr:hypothetical protein JCM19045_1083 [Bacillus sp. JCM 19045]GAF16236.1 hypothetical protein JCM19046_651 [Bacillus sp. JCM 19046]
MTNLNEWVFILGNFGFPVVVAGYLLIRFEKKIEVLTAVINELKNTLTKKR